MSNRVIIIGSLLMVVLLLMACDYQASPPKRASSIPSEAVWVGGADGGVWIWCREGDVSNVCTVYNEFTGEPWVHGHFVIKGTNQGVSSQELKYSFFDGKCIGLADGRILEPAE